MTQDKDLLLKDLCARVPYGVIVETSKGKGHVCDINLTIFGTSVGVNINPTIRDTFDIEDIQPYLFPLSSMTEEHHLEIEILTNGQIGIDKYSIWDFSGCSELSLSQTLDVFDWLNRNHFDYRGLIEKGLAIDATGLNIY